MSEGFCARMFFCAATVFALCGSTYVSLLLYQENTSPKRDFFQRWESCLNEPKACAKDIKKHSENFTLLLKELETEFKSSKVMKKIAMEVVNDILNPGAKESAASSSSMEKQLMKALSQDPQSREQMLRLMQQQKKHTSPAAQRRPVPPPPVPRAAGRAGHLPNTQQRLKNPASQAPMATQQPTPPASRQGSPSPPPGQKNQTGPQQQVPANQR